MSENSTQQKLQTVISPDLEGWLRLMGSETVIRMAAIFSYVLHAGSHSINPVRQNSRTELDVFYLKMRIMWRYFGLPQLPHKEHWPETAHVFYFSVHSDKELVEMMHQERKAFPGAQHIRRCLAAPNKGFAESTLPLWQHDIKDEEDLVTHLTRMVTLIGEGDLMAGVCKFEWMKEPVIELKVSGSPGFL